MTDSKENCYWDLRVEGLLIRVLVQDFCGVTVDEGKARIIYHALKQRANINLIVIV